MKIFPFSTPGHRVEGMQVSDFFPCRHHMDSPVLSIIFRLCRGRDVSLCYHLLYAEYCLSQAMSLLFSEDIVAETPSFGFYCKLLMLFKSQKVQDSQVATNPHYSRSFPKFYSTHSLWRFTNRGSPQLARNLHCKYFHKIKDEQNDPWASPIHYTDFHPCLIWIASFVFLNSPPIPK